MHEKAEIEDLREGPVYRYANSVAKRKFLHSKTKELELERAWQEESLALREGWCLQ